MGTSEEAASEVARRAADLFAAPPDWLRSQVRECARQGSPERLVNPLANAVSTHLFGSPWRWRDVLPAVEAHARGLGRDEGSPP